jgi:uncharacterized protein (DUF1800 family)
MGALHHLLRRAGFGARSSEIAAYAALGVAGTTELLLHPEQSPDHMADLQREIGSDYIDFTSLVSIQNWWMYRMAHSQRPLEEKMTLFWHNHFATANFKVDNPPWMWQQNDMFRTHALGNFRQLLGGVARDPAMLTWLDGAENTKGRPNENFGRELMELFTLGIGGGYTETDVKEGARAFTGWYYDNNDESFIFDPARHDSGIKTFLGETGRLNGDDVLDIVAAHPSTGRFLSTKLYKFFVHADPTTAEIDALATTYYQSGFEIRPMVAQILTSQAFYAPETRYAKIKSPAEFMAIAIRTLDIPMAAINDPGGTLRSFGQELFNPPNVKGWPEGHSWMNSTTLLARINFATAITQEMDRRGLMSQNLRKALPSSTMKLANTDELVDAVWSIMLPGHNPSVATRNALINYVGTGSTGSPLDRHGAGLCGLIMSAPEYQLA